MTNQNTKNSRVLQELLETKAELSTYDLVSKTDMAFMRVLCEEPPAYTPERIGSIRDGNCEAEPSCIRSPLKREHLERSIVGVPCSGFYYAVGPRDVTEPGKTRRPRIGKCGTGPRGPPISWPLPSLNARTPAQTR